MKQIAKIKQNYTNPNQRNGRIKFDQQRRLKINITTSRFNDSKLKMQRLEQRNPHRTLSLYAIILGRIYVKTFNLERNFVFWMLCALT